jgi:hypothetical protein
MAEADAANNQMGLIEQRLALPRQQAVLRAREFYLRTMERKILNFTFADVPALGHGTTVSLQLGVNLRRGVVWGGHAFHSPFDPVAEAGIPGDPVGAQVYTSIHAATDAVPALRGAAAELFTVWNGWHNVPLWHLIFGAPPTPDTLHTLCDILNENRDMFAAALALSGAAGNLEVTQLKRFGKFLVLDVRVKKAAAAALFEAVKSIKGAIEENDLLRQAAPTIEVYEPTSWHVTVDKYSMVQENQHPNESELIAAFNESLTTRKMYLTADAVQLVLPGQVSRLMTGAAGSRMPGIVQKRPIWS